MNPEKYRRRHRDAKAKSLEFPDDDEVPTDDDDQRSRTQRDRDRLIYSPQFRRLQGVTQILGPREGHIFHNRLTHSLKAAQVARRLAELLNSEQPEIVRELGGLDPDATEAAALAHDLGHPPFGHVAEEALDSLAQKYGAADGFEGNAQSFRILVRLAAHRDSYVGLDLTRATLAGVLKYPWLRDREGEGKKAKKYGAYRAEREDFEFARGLYSSDRQSLEAAVMDHADDVAYSVHDLADFYRAGLIPIARLKHSEDALDEFLARWVEDPASNVSEGEVERNRGAIENLLDLFYMEHRYEGDYGQQSELQTQTSSLIEDFMMAASLNDPEAVEAGEDVLLVEEPRQVEMYFLQGLVWHYVITNPRLATQQRGQRRVIETLFEEYLEAVRARDESIVPPPYHYQLEDLGPRSNSSSSATSGEVRLTVDIIAGMSDRRAEIMYERLTGHTPGSVFDPLAALEA